MPLRCRSRASSQTRYAHVRKVVVDYEKKYKELHGALPSKSTYCPKVGKLREEYFKLKARLAGHL